MRWTLPLWIVALTASATFASEQGGSTPFAGTIMQSVAAVIVFLIVVFVLQKFAWGPILKGLQDREGKIKEDLERAEKAAKQAEYTLQDYQKKLDEARVEAARIIDNARVEAERLSHRIQEDAQRDIETAKKRATSEIQYAKETALQEIFKQTGKLATDVAGKILRREIQTTDQQRLVEESLAGLQSQHVR